MPAREFNSQQVAIEAEVKAASDALKAVSGGGEYGLTPDAVKTSLEYQKRRQAYCCAFQRLRQFNKAKAKAKAKAKRKP